MFRDNRGWKSAFVLAALVVTVCRPLSASELETGFASPPREARPLGWWHWINGNVTIDGIDADLQAAKAAGMGGVQMFDVEIYAPPGPVRYGSDRWFAHVRHAIRRAAALGLEFHAMNTPGWSASGGPWVTPQRSMKRLVWSETDVSGGAVSASLPRPDLTLAYPERAVPAQPFYADIAVIAVPAGVPRIADIDKKIGWGRKPVTRDTRTLPGIPADRVIVLSGKMDAAGGLVTKLPRGNWTILRFGYTTTGKTNHPAQPEGHGLEIDKLDAAAVAFQFDQSLGRMIREAGPLAGNTFNAILFDSFEGGYQNWTAAMPTEFARLKGYSLLRWLPVLTGRVVESSAASEAVLWDFRQVIEELIAENYLGTMHRLAARHGMKIYSESQGGPLTPMSANRHVDVPMNEFWMPDATPRAASIRMTTSAATFLGRRIVAAEAFTATPENGRFQNTPASLKRAGDHAFALGLNRFAFHSYTHQPVTEAAPGFGLGRYGTHFGRLNTWWPFAGAWVEYVSRSQFLLQQGTRVADVCFLVDEDLGYALPKAITSSLPGHDFEVAYPADVRAMSVERGVLRHPQGAAFRLLVTPEPQTSAGWVAEIATLRKLVSLVRAGATLAGPAPAAPAGLNDVERREEYDQLVSELWSGLPTRGFKRVGEGKVYAGLTPAEILRAEKIAPDIRWDAPMEQLRFLHRRTGDADIYFVFNYSDQPRQSRLELRIPDRVPEIWNAMHGTRADAPTFGRTATGVSVPVQLEPWGSTFLVFRRPLGTRWIAGANAAGLNLLDRPGAMLTQARSARLKLSDGSDRDVSLPALPAPVALDRDWRVEFPTLGTAGVSRPLDRLASWSENADPAIRYHSGTGVYRTRVELPAVRDGIVAMLDLGRVADIARVKVNGRDAGIAWSPPFRLDVTPYLRAGTNTLEIHVANRWVNRLIGDEAIPVNLEYQKNGSRFTDGRITSLPAWLYRPNGRREWPRHSFATWKHYEAGASLLPAGLLGPVKIEWWQEISPAIK
ncbi:glycosyl hydrolase [Sphingomonas sp. BT-65]|uniref:glycosyl hydrolase n=1 Tax=Sphingomonas sp. BT-65 TaxID=2989821 RepID=UPI0022356EFA|nr:glycosyl hydrolase [Sphingomonas sp. BT-65]MCW4461184.1 glycosyl hydrolase [Sphingomonas sp. BT-65]